MPIYKTTISGVDTPRLVRADTAAKARDHVVTTDLVKAEELADLIEAGATIERAVDKPAAEEAPSAELDLSKTATSGSADAAA